MSDNNINVRLIEGRELSRAVDRMARRAKSWTEWIASVGVSVLVHAAKHGDVTLLQRFYDALPNNYTKPFVMWIMANGIREWLNLKSGKFILKKSDDAKAARKAFADDPRIEDWTSFRVQRVTEFDLESVIRRLDSLKKKTSEELPMPEEFHNHIAAALSIAQRMKEAQEVAMPVAA